jgi:hypothetical protein
MTTDPTPTARRRHVFETFRKVIREYTYQTFGQGEAQEMCSRLTDAALATEATDPLAARCGVVKNDWPEDTRYVCVLPPHGWDKSGHHFWPAARALLPPADGSRVEPVGALQSCDISDPFCCPHESDLTSHCWACHPNGAPR